MRPPRSAMDVAKHFRIVKTMPAGTVMLSASDPPDFVYVLTEGQANILVGNAIVEIAARGALLDVMALRRQAAQRHRRYAYAVRGGADRRHALRPARTRDAGIQPLAPPKPSTVLLCG